jgi:hypothetical protein
MTSYKTIVESNITHFKRYFLVFFAFIGITYFENHVYCAETFDLLEENVTVAMIITCICIGAILLLAESLDMDYFAPYNVKYFVPDLGSWRIIDNPPIPTSSENV